MNGTRRGVNRALLGVFGLVLAAVGAIAILAGTSPVFAQRWTATGTDLWARIRDNLAAAKIPGADVSWWSVGVLAALVLVAVLLVCWIASQGTGRSNQLAQQKTAEGKTTVDTAVAAQAIKAALADNTQVLATSVQSWNNKSWTTKSWKNTSGGSNSGLKISIQTRKGASPVEVMAAVEHLVEGLDHLLGFRLPVLVRIKAGTRSLFARTERVA
ncbi:hypothetical protein ACX80D_10310 [Arthrobacter sp. Sr24]